MSASPKRPMSPDELVAAEMLRTVITPPGTYDRKFHATILLRLASPSVIVGESLPQISEQEAPNLWRLICRYRRQIRHPERVKYIRIAEVLSDLNLNRRTKGIKKLAQRAKDRAKHHAKKAKAVSV